MDAGGEHPTGRGARQGLHGRETSTRAQVKDPLRYALDVGGVMPGPLLTWAAMGAHHLIFITNPLPPKRSHHSVLYADSSFPN